MPLFIARVLYAIKLVAAICERPSRRKVILARRDRQPDDNAFAESSRWRRAKMRVVHRASLIIDGSEVSVG